MNRGISKDALPGRLNNNAKYSRVQRLVDGCRGEDVYRATKFDVVLMVVSAAILFAALVWRSMS